LERSSKTEKGGSGFNRRLLSMASLTRLTRDNFSLNTTAFKEIVGNKLVTIGKSEAVEESEGVWKQNQDPNKKKPKKIKDHVVPNLVLINKAREMWETGFDRKEPYHVIKKKIARLYKQFGKVVELTKEEENRLVQSGLKQSMPEDWSAKDQDWDAKDPFARYRKVGIKWKLEGQPL
jgi:hypothetical protein